MAGCGIEQELPFSADAVWARIRDVGAVHEWGPGIRGCTVEGEGVGAVRTLDMGSMTFVERVEALDDGERTFRYSITEGPIPVANYLATITVWEAGPSRSRVSWSCRFDAPEISEPQARDLAVQLASAYRDTLAALGRVLAGPDGDPPERR